jgi:hypothetical protein
MSREQQHLDLLSEVRAREVRCHRDAVGQDERAIYQQRVHALDAAIAALSQPQAASSTQAASIAELNAALGVAFADDPAAAVRAHVAVEPIISRLASSTTPGSTGAVDALPAKWRERARELDKGPESDTVAALCYGICADELEAALAQPAQQGER